MARASAQTHLVWGIRTFGHHDPRRYALVLLSSAFGGGMSSRLFQRVREELGLAYTVYSYQSFYHDAGTVGVYVGTRPESADKAQAVVQEELARLAAHGLTEVELWRRERPAERANRPLHGVEQRSAAPAGGGSSLR